MINIKAVFFIHKNKFFYVNVNYNICACVIKTTLDINNFLIANNFVIDITV